MPNKRSIGFWILFPFRWAFWTAISTSIPILAIHWLTGGRTKLLLGLFFIIGAVYWMELLWPDDRRDEQNQKANPAR